jgi:anti-anti-sigma factor
MQVLTEYRGDILILSIDGRVDSSNSAEWETKIKSALRENTLRLIMDMQKLEYMSSSGVRVLLSTHLSLYQRGGELVISHPPLFAYKIFQNSGFENLCKLFETTEEALKYFNEKIR